MSSLTLSARTIEMPLSLPTPFVPMNAISSQTYIGTNENNHLPPLKSGNYAPKQGESPPSHLTHSSHSGSTHLPSLGSSANNSLQNLTSNSDSLNLSLSSHVSHNTHNTSHNSHSQQSNSSQSNSPMIKNGRSESNSNKTIPKMAVSPEIVVKLYLNKLTSSKGYPRYCKATTTTHGTTLLHGGVSRRGKIRGPPGSKDLKEALKNCEDPLFLDFIRKCLQWDPEQRMTPSKALRHAWLRRRLPRPPDEKVDVVTGHSVQPTTAAVTTSGSRSSSKTAHGSAGLSSKLRELNDQRSSTIQSRHPQQPSLSHPVVSSVSGGHSISVSNHPSLTQSNHQSLNAVSAHKHQQLHSHNGSSHDSHSSHGSSGSSRYVVSKEITLVDPWR
ncbi:Similar to DYRK2: Dual specificity tyrosine-phosphorylation-regulated kinase 2 (Gallus gallus) [Cotesia congregata]|uniref:Similar to DYRK2: Dual specificity tyrosine-phosphorylation-regulated kinase 2 (Gallus gallus) n=1 Tax=Cotesia congregata TaxID=51543 RepID=A0A8J2HEU6_COTCN|nr:Similar to DYRK2: Dual specificity tyrosine-phosphorylation-regulated kinase 2 (Gallus gallus) [Cotesia congregata]